MKTCKKCYYFLRMYLIRKPEILNFLETFSTHPGKSLKVHFNLFLSILIAYESEEKLIWMKNVFNKSEK